MISEWFDNILKFIGETIYNGLTWVLSFLDICPVKSLVASLDNNPYLEWIQILDYFTGFSILVEIITGLLVAIIIWYGLQVLLRFVKVIN